MTWGFPEGAVVKNPPANARDGGRRFPGEGNGNPLQSSCLENSMDTGAWRGPGGLQRVRRDWAQHSTDNELKL